MTSEDVTTGGVEIESPQAAAVMAERAAAARGLLEVAMERHARVVAMMGRGVEGLKDEEVVHDLRVATRRLTEVARMMAGFVDKPTGRVVEGSLRALRQAMGELRDNDVTREHLEKWKMPGVLKKVARAVAGELAGRREGQEKAAGEAMASASVQGAMVVLARVIEEQKSAERRAEPERRMAGAVKRAMKRREKQMERAFGKAAMKQTAEHLHEARIAVKKLRYVMELADAGGVEQGLKKRMKVLKGMQELLGEHHDVHVVVEILERRVMGEKVRGLRPAWGKWKRAMERGQGRRAAAFFVESYMWMNG